MKAEDREAVRDWLYDGSWREKFDGDDLAELLDHIDSLEAALARVLERDGGKSCGCINKSREAEHEYEMGRCPHQRAAALLPGKT